MPPRPSDSWVDELIKVAKTVWRFLFGSIYYRFASGLTSLGAFLVAGGTWRDALIGLIAEALGAERTVAADERGELFAQITGVAMIGAGIAIFFHFARQESRSPHMKIAVSIIDAWANDRTLTDEQRKWLKEHPKWDDEFWEITERTHLPHQQRLKIMRINLLPPKI